MFRRLDFLLIFIFFLQASSFRLGNAINSGHEPPPDENDENSSKIHRETLTRQLFRRINVTEETDDDNKTEFSPSEKKNYVDCLLISGEKNQTNCDMSRKFLVIWSEKKRQLRETLAKRLGNPTLKNVINRIKGFWGHSVRKLKQLIRAKRGQTLHDDVEEPASQNDPQQTAELEDKENSSPENTEEEKEEKGDDEEKKEDDGPETTPTIDEAEISTEKAEVVDEKVDDKIDGNEKEETSSPEEPEVANGDVNQSVDTVEKEETTRPEDVHEQVDEHGEEEEEEDEKIVGGAETEDKKEENNVGGPETHEEDEKVVDGAETQEENGEDEKVEEVESHKENEEVEENVVGGEETQEENEEEEETVDAASPSEDQPDDVDTEDDEEVASEEGPEEKEEDVDESDEDEKSDKEAAEKDYEDENVELPEESDGAGDDDENDEESDEEGQEEEETSDAGEEESEDSDEDNEDEENETEDETGDETESEETEEAEDEEPEAGELESEQEYVSIISPQDIWNFFVAIKDLIVDTGDYLLSLLFKNMKHGLRKYRIEDKFEKQLNLLANSRNLDSKKALEVLLKKIRQQFGRSYELELVKFLKELRDEYLP